MLKSTILLSNSTEMVLDHSDGDFSVCINGHWHNWINDDSIVMIADYVEKELATQETFVIA